MFGCLETRRFMKSYFSKLVLWTAIPILLVALSCQSQTPAAADIPSFLADETSAIVKRDITAMGYQANQVSQIDILSIKYLGQGVWEGNCNIVYKFTNNMGYTNTRYASASWRFFEKSRTVELR